METKIGILDFLFFFGIRISSVTLTLKLVSPIAEDKEDAQEAVYC